VAECDFCLGQSDDRNVDPLLCSSFEPSGQRRRTSISQKRRQRDLEQLREQIRGEEAMDEHEGVIPLLALDEVANKRCHHARGGSAWILLELRVEKGSKERMNVGRARSTRRQKAETHPFLDRGVGGVSQDKLSQLGGYRRDESELSESGLRVRRGRLVQLFGEILVESVGERSLWGVKAVRKCREPDYGGPPARKRAGPPPPPARPGFSS